MATPISADRFYHDGRGPSLHRVHWSREGHYLLAIDYSNHDDGFDQKHVKFVRPQVVMITPEEVINYGDGDLTGLLVRYRPAAMFDRGRSPWLESFSPRHLSQCRHFQLFFYDELFDVICEGVECVLGRYPGEGTG